MAKQERTAKIGALSRGEQDYICGAVPTDTLVFGYQQSSSVYGTQCAEDVFCNSVGSVTGHCVGT